MSATFLAASAGERSCRRAWVGVVEAPLQGEHQRKVLPHARIRFRVLRCLGQHALGFGQLLRERVGKAEIGQDAGIAGRDLQRRKVEGLGAIMQPDAVRGDALRREDMPVGLVGGMGAREHLERLVVIAGVDQRLAIGGRGFPDPSGTSRPPSAERRPLAPSDRARRARAHSRARPSSRRDLRCSACSSSRPARAGRPAARPGPLTDAVMSLSRKQPLSEDASTAAATAEAKWRRRLAWPTRRSKDDIMHNPRLDALRRTCTQPGDFLRTGRAGLFRSASFVKC